MATVHIPSLIQDLTGGVETVDVPAGTLRQVIDRLESRFPGIRDRLCSEGRIRPNIAVWIDGEINRQGMMRDVGEASQIHFLPAISGG
ncbi:MAG: MoaD/ThiS family protein [Planctomycetes bacterium]|nr:MoaD/ThiS family protein [Planctomycetota bacterium]